MGCPVVVDEGALWFFSGTQKVPPQQKLATQEEKKKKKVYVKPPKTKCLKHSQKEMIFVSISPFPSIIKLQI